MENLCFVSKLTLVLLKENECSSLCFEITPRWHLGPGCRRPLGAMVRVPFCLTPGVYIKVKNVKNRSGKRASVPTMKISAQTGHKLYNTSFSKSEILATMAYKFRQDWYTFKNFCNRLGKTWAWIVTQSNEKKISIHGWPIFSHADLCLSSQNWAFTWTRIAKITA